MVHASCKNKDPGSRIRLATDLRFVNPEEPYDKVSLLFLFRFLFFCPICCTLCVQRCEATEESLPPIEWFVKILDKILLSSLVSSIAIFASTELKYLNPTDYKVDIK